MYECASLCYVVFFFSSRRRHTRYWRDWSSDVCSSDLLVLVLGRKYWVVCAPMCFTDVNEVNQTCPLLLKSCTCITDIWFIACGFLLLRLEHGVESKDNILITYKSIHQDLRAAVDWVHIKVMKAHLFGKFLVSITVYNYKELQSRASPGKICY